MDRARRWRRAGDIFVVRTGNGVVVKRVAKNATRDWLLQSDHPT